MKDVECSSIQRMMIKRADFGDFLNNGRFNGSASIDTKCSSVSNCQVKSLCGGKSSCDLTIDNNLLPSLYCVDSSKKIYTEYTCVDAYSSTSITTAPKIRLSESPFKGFVEIKDGSIWRKVNEENWENSRQKLLCRHLGFEETVENEVDWRELASGEEIANGDLICYNTHPRGTSCCIHLQRSSITSNVDMPYATCQICDGPLLEDKSTFPDFVFSGSGSNNYKDARFSESGWCATGNGTKYLLLDLQKEYHITRVIVMGDREQTKRSASYSLKYSHDKTLVNSNSPIQIKGNQNGYQASITNVDIYDVRYLKLDSTGNSDFCLRIELCGEVQASVVKSISIKPASTKAGFGVRSVEISKVTGEDNDEDDDNKCKDVDDKCEGLDNKGEVADGKKSEQFSEEKPQMDLLIIPSVAVLACFLLLLGIFIACYTNRRRLWQSHKSELSEETNQKEEIDTEEEETQRAYLQALQEGKAKNNRILIMLVGKGRAGKTSLMRRLLGLPFDKDQPSTYTTGIDVNVIELTDQNAEDPWKKREVKEFMTSESETETMLYRNTAEYLDRGVQRSLEGDAPEPVKPLLREEICEIKSQSSTEHDQNEVLRVFVSDFARQSNYYDNHGCFVKPHCPYVLVHDLSLEFDKPAVRKFKDRDEEEEIEMNNAHLNTDLDNFASWLKFLQGSGECQDQQFPDTSGHSCTTVKRENFKCPPVLIALTHSDKAKGNDSKIDCVQRRINNVVSEAKYENVIPEFFLIDNTLEGDDGDDVRKLRRKLFDLSNGVLNREILMPLKWLEFEAALSRTLSPDCKYIPFDEAKREAEACGVKEFDQAIKFLHRRGVVVHHSGSSKVVLDPLWLMDRFTKAMPCKLDALPRHTLGEFKQKGILFQEYFETLQDAELLKDLMQKFNLICPCQHDGKPAFYVPSVAPTMEEGKKLRVSPYPSLFVTFPRQLVPISLFTKLQVKLISEWKKRFPNQQARPSFYCNYSLIALIMDGNVYDVCLTDFHKFIKITVLPKQVDNNTHHFKFASNLKATLKKCLDDLKSPDQLLFSMTSYDLEVKCTSCFGKDERRCSRHHETKRNSDRCGHFWKLSDLQRFYNDQSAAVCVSNDSTSEEFDINSVKIWLNTGSVAAI